MKTTENGWHDMMMYAKKRNGPQAASTANGPNQNQTKGGFVMAAYANILSNHIKSIGRGVQL